MLIKLGKKFCTTKRIRIKRPVSTKPYDVFLLLISTYLIALVGKVQIYSLNFLNLSETEDFEP